MEIGTIETENAQDIREANCIFEQPWWFDAVTADAWAVATVVTDGKIIARLPYATHKNRWGHLLIGNPHMTQTIGPWLALPEGKYASKLKKQHELLKDLIGQLPSADHIDLQLHPSQQNVLPFHWAGFTSQLAYTYRIDGLADSEIVYRGFTDKCRNTIRKAEKSVAVQADATLDCLLAMLDKTWQRQGRNSPYNRELLTQLDHACQKRGQRAILAAVDARGNTHAAMYLVWDTRTAYYLMGGADPDFRDSGAQSLLVWHALQFVRHLAITFDFEGSMTENIEHFFRSFGAVQVPLLRVRKISRRMQRYLMVKDVMSLIRGAR